MPLGPQPTTARGLLAGLVATIIAVPGVAAVAAAAIFVQNVVLADVAGHRVSLTGLANGDEMMAAIVVAVLTGAITATITGLIALKVISGAAGALFVAAASAGALLIGLAAFAWLSPGTGGHAGALAVPVLIAWLAAALGYLSAAVGQGDGSEIRA